MRIDGLMCCPAVWLPGDIEALGDPERATALALSLAEAAAGPVMSAAAPTSSSVGTASPRTRHHKREAGFCCCETILRFSHAALHFLRIILTALPVLHMQS